MNYCGYAQPKLLQIISNIYINIKGLEEKNLTGKKINKKYMHFSVNSSHYLILKKKINTFCKICECNCFKLNSSKFVLSKNQLPFIL